MASARRMGRAEVWELVSYLLAEKLSDEEKFVGRSREKVDARRAE